MHFSKDAQERLMRLDRTKELLREIMWHDQVTKEREECSTL